MTLGLLLGTVGQPWSTRAAGSKRRDPSIQVRFHAQVFGYDPTFGVKVQVGNPPREIAVEKIPSITEHDFASFYPYRAADGSYSAVFKLERHGEATLEEVSTDRRGSMLVVVVNGQPVTSLLIDRTIKDGIIFVPSGLTEANIRALGASFNLMGQSASGRPRAGGPATNSLPATDLPSR